MKYRNNIMVNISNPVVNHSSNATKTYNRYHSRDRHIQLIFNNTDLWNKNVIWYQFNFIFKAITLSAYMYHYVCQQRSIIF